MGVGTMSYAQFTINAIMYFGENRREQRFGQAVFNYLHHVRPDVADKLRASELDPFHSNSVPQPVWTFIHENW